MNNGMSAFPDIEAAVLTIIRNSGMRAYPSIPKNPTWPLVRAMRVGGIPVVRERLDSALIQFDSFANDKAGAFDGCESTRQLLMEAEGSATGDCYITSVTMVTGPQWLPDTETGRDRYVMRALVAAHIVD